MERAPFANLQRVPAHRIGHPQDIVRSSVLLPRSLIEKRRVANVSERRGACQITALFRHNRSQRVIVDISRACGVVRYKHLLSRHYGLAL